MIARLLCLSCLVLTNSVEAQTVTHVRDSVYPGARVKAQFERGRSVSRIRRVGSEWVVVMPEISGSLLSDTVFPHEAIQARWKELAITDVTFAPPWWVATVTRGTTLHEQRYVSADTLPKDFIARGWEERRHITSVAFGKGRYVVVMSKGTGYRAQRWVLRDSLPVSWIKAAWNEGYHVTSLTHVNGRWLVVASLDKFRPQQYAYAAQWPQHTVDSLVAVGYEVTDAAYGDNVYLVVLTRYGNDRPMMRPRNDLPPENTRESRPDLLGELSTTRVRRASDRVTLGVIASRRGLGRAAGARMVHRRADAGTNAQAGACATTTGARFLRATLPASSSSTHSRHVSCVSAMRYSFAFASHVIL